MLKNYFEILDVDEKAGDLKLSFAYNRKLFASDFPQSEKTLIQYNHFNEINEAYIVLSENSESFINLLKKESQGQEFTSEDLKQIKSWEEKGKNYASLVAYRGRLQSKLEFYTSVIMISLKEVIVFTFRFIWESIKYFLFTVQRYL